MKYEKNKLVLDEVIEQEIALYNFENMVSRNAMKFQRESQEAQSKFEEAQRKFEEAQSTLISIQDSRIWRYTSTYRKLGGKFKTLLKSSPVGKFVLRVLKKVFG